jgi:hypothetical protein
MKRVTIWALAGAGLFSLITTWLGPKLIGWYVTPADQPAALSCQAAVIGAMRRLVELQLIATGVGFLLGLVLGIAFRPRTVPPPPAAAKPA